MNNDMEGVPGARALSTVFTTNRPEGGRRQPHKGKHQNAFDDAEIIDAGGVIGEGNDTIHRTKPIREAAERAFMSASRWLFKEIAKCAELKMP